MKATPEDVAKSKHFGWQFSGNRASMKATPEDVAKTAKTITYVEGGKTPQ